MNLLPLDEIVFLEEPHSYHLRGKEYPSVTRILTQTLGDAFSGVPQDRLEFAQNRGNMVHMAVQLLTAGELDWTSVDPRIEGYVRAAERFHIECPGKIVYTEHRMVDPVSGLAGTPDIVKFVRGRRSLIDYKTGQQMKPRMRLQTAGYKKLNDLKFPNAPIYDRYGLHLGADGFYKLIQHEDLDDEAAFEKFFNEAKAKIEADPFREKYR